MPQLWTIRSILEWTITYFKKLGIDRARLETEILLASSLGVDRLWLYTHYDQPLIRPELDAFRSVVIRRSKREPLQYILGKWEFWALDFIVSPKVLIPRKETEHLVEFTLGLAKRGDIILDLCTGCGNIAISLAKSLPSSTFWATDIVRDAVNLARVNAEMNRVSDRINFIIGDLLLPFQVKKTGFDIIVCNPPYIPTHKLEGLQPEIKRYEPRIALDGGKDGLIFYRRLIPDAISFLKPSGYLVMEIGSEQARVVRNMLVNKGYQDIKIIKDYTGYDRVIAAKYL